MAQTFGSADAVVNLREVTNPKTICNHFTPKGYGFDRVIEAVGLPETWEKSLSLVRRGGLVNLFGGCESGSSITIETHRLHYDEITMTSPFHHTPKTFKKAFELIASGTLDPTTLITKTVSLSQTVFALEQVETGQAIKVALKP